MGIKAELANSADHTTQRTHVRLHARNFGLRLPWRGQRRRLSYPLERAPRARSPTARPAGITSCSMAIPPFRSYRRLHPFQGGVPWKAGEVSSWHARKPNAAMSVCRRWSLQQLSYFVMIDLTPAQGRGRGQIKTSKGVTTMIEYGLRMCGKGRSFRDCVRDCARNPEIVALFNELHGTALSAPVESLMQHDQVSPARIPIRPRGRRSRDSLAATAFAGRPPSAVAGKPSAR